ncbi:MAG TPA: hypothetical protein VJ183_09155 [Chloroflexia bacterium]|nr:hypothetical protein [Chloroflexia bacterium]
MDETNITLGTALGFSTESYEAMATVCGSPGGIIAGCIICAIFLPAQPIQVETCTHATATLHPKSPNLSGRTRYE